MAQQEKIFSIDKNQESRAAMKKKKKRNHENLKSPSVQTFNIPVIDDQRIFVRKINTWKI